MKKFVLIAFAVVFGLAFSCEEENNNQTEPRDLNVKDITDSGCKEFDIKCTNNESCVDYSTENADYLKFKRTNAAFNCCIDYVIIESKLDSTGTITITERENAGYCDCICLYDIEYTMGPLDYGKYDIVIIEQSFDTLDFSLDFDYDTHGQYCEERSGYPWGM
jgi:hypothetical protein